MDLTLKTSLYLTIVKNFESGGYEPGHYDHHEAVTSTWNTNDERGSMLRHLKEMQECIHAFETVDQRTLLAVVGAPKLDSGEWVVGGWFSTLDLETIGRIMGVEVNSEVSTGALAWDWGDEYEDVFPTLVHGNSSYGLKDEVSYYAVPFVNLDGSPSDDWKFKGAGDDVE